MQLKTLPSNILYSSIRIPCYDDAPIYIPRRELFDIRAQLMAEDQTSNPSTIPGLSTDDIKPNVYEGGFKTWECSIDLAGYLVTMLRRRNHRYEVVRHVIEVFLQSSHWYNFD